MYSIVLNEEREIPLPELDGIRISGRPWSMRFYIDDPDSGLVFISDRKLQLTDPDCLNRLEESIAPLEIREAYIVMDNDAEIYLLVYMDFPDTLNTSGLYDECLVLKSLRLIYRDEESPAVLFRGRVELFDNIQLWK